jgi:hypothetical protein
VAEAEALNPDLPSDLAVNHDHYLYGARCPECGEPFDPAGLPRREG